MTPLYKTLLNLLIDELPALEQDVLLADLLGRFTPDHILELRAQACDMVITEAKLTKAVRRPAEPYAFGGWGRDDVDRQGGSFTQDELNDNGWH